LVEKIKAAFEAHTAHTEQVAAGEESATADSTGNAQAEGDTHEQQLAALQSALEAGFGEQAASWEAERAELIAELESLKAREGQVERLLLDVEAARVEHTRQSRHQLGDVIVRALRHLAGPALVAPDEILKDRLHAVSRALVTERDVTIRVRPEDVTFAQEFLSEHESWRVVSDENVDMGVLAETESEQLDATMAGALVSVEEAVRAWIASGQTQQSENPV
jgi:hypothetical protein